jgi:hypothetical protein
MSEPENLRRIIIARDATEVLRRVIEDCVVSELSYGANTSARNVIGAHGCAQKIASDVISRIGRMNMLAVDLP